MQQEAIYKIAKKLHDKRLLRYIVSGIAALASDYGTFLILYYIFNISVELSAPLGLTAGLVVSFMLNKLWTFKSVENTMRSSTLMQTALYLLLFLINNIFTIYFIKTSLIFGMSAATGKIGASIAITLWNYALYKKIIFVGKKDDS